MIWLYEKPLPGSRQMRFPAFLQPRLPSGFAIRVPDNPFTLPYPPLAIVPQRENRLGLCRVDVRVHSVRTPLEKCLFLCLKNDVAGPTFGFIPKDRAVIASLTVHSHRWIRIDPSKENGTLGVSEDQLTARVKELASARRPPRIVTIRQHRHLAVEVCGSYQAICERKKHLQPA